VKDSAATGLLAVKLLAQYLSGKKPKVGLSREAGPPSQQHTDNQRQEPRNRPARPTQDEVLVTLQEWLGDSACNRNVTVLLVAGTIYAHEGNYPDALKVCHGSSNLEL
jgi:coatomer protein complex subunit epsilon